MLSKSYFLFLVLAHLLLTAKVASQEFNGNITRSGPTLTPSGSCSYMTSPSREFAFGFQPLSPSLSLLAIWFYQLSSSQPIIWFAKKSNSTGAPVLAPVESKLRLTQTGQLMLAGPDSKEIWSLEARSATNLALLDNGNLILCDDSQVALWQSFDWPVDTLVPGQSLGKDSALQSKLTDSDFSPGRFILLAQEGYLGYYLVLQSSDLPSQPYYWIKNNNGSAPHVVLNQNSVYLYYELANGSPFNFSQYPSTRYYQHATIDPDGVFRVYVYDKKLSNQGDWSVVSESPENACSMYVEVGSGMCGFNAYCTQSKNLNPPRLNCTCPEKYTFFDTNRPYLGCRPDFAMQSCKVDETKNFKFLEMQDTDWFSAGDYIQFTGDEDECKISCLTDCFCSVAIYRATSCWKKKFPLSNGRQITDYRGKALLKVRVNSTSGNQTPTHIPISGSKKGRKDLVVVGAVMLGATLFILLVVAISSLYFFHSKRGGEIDQVESSPMGMNMKIFSYKGLHDATKGFAEELGRGSFGIVYKGTIDMGDHPVPVAVKKLDRLLKDGDREFTNEVQSIGQIHHKNLVRLFGFCNEGPHRILVYEYMNNGSLNNFIFGAVKLGWNIRAQIALGVARGLCYLHEGCSSQIIHCDIKPHNILLDDSLVPRISDFGLAKLLGVDQTRATTSNIRGTKGYFAPEWFKNTGVTPKMDVYSFGVLLLEIICCRRNVEQMDEEYNVLLYWAYDCFRNGKIDLLIQEDEEAEADIGRVERFIRVAIWCIQENPAIRPTMHKVAQMLERAMAIAPPPDSSSSL